jgi:hypothetical protein
MRYRKLRVAWSVGWGVLCVLLVALWVRSYRNLLGEEVLVTARNRYAVHSFSGTVIFQQRRRVFFNSRERMIPYPHNYFFTLTKRTTLGVGHHSDGWYNAVSIPYALLLPAMAGVAASPWIRWRFSLRTLLIGMTLAAVVLGTVVWVAT